MLSLNPLFVWCGVEGADFAIEGRTLTNDAIVNLAEEIASLPELNSFTFESNKIVDQEAICALLSNLKSFEKLENLNIRNNKLSS